MIALVDAWTLGHVAVGVLYGIVKRVEPRHSELWPLAFFAALWEWFENTELAKLHWGDPWTNSLVDIVAAVGAAFLVLVVKARRQGIPAGEVD